MKLGPKEHHLTCVIEEAYQELLATPRDELPKDIQEHMERLGLVDARLEAEKDCDGKVISLLPYLKSP